MTIRKATLTDIPQMREIFAIARKFMAETGNPNQWAASYPSVEQLTADIESGDSYVCTEEGRIVATFVLRGGDDPTYAVIYDGAWKNHHPYATIHRIASNGEVKGIFALAMEYALQRYSTIRIDTHRDNKVMQHASIAGMVTSASLISMMTMITSKINDDRRTSLATLPAHKCKDAVPGQFSSTQSTVEHGILLPELDQ